MRSLARRQQIIIYALMALVMVVFLGPIFWFILLAFRHPSQAYTLPPQIFVPLDFGNFSHTFVEPGKNAPQLINSVIVSSGATLLSLPFALSAAYALSRFAMRGKEFVLNWYISLLIAPPIVFIIPYFVLMSRIGWSGTYQAMILTLQTLAIPFSVWLLKSFIDEVPLDLEEAAWVDGANRFSAFFRIIIPLALPGIIVTSMFTFVFSWNNVIFPLALSKQSTTTLPVGTISFFASTGVYWGHIAATAVIAMLPPMIIFLLLGRYVVRGLTFGAVKG